jgi:hypothetical protein
MRAKAVFGFMFLVMVSALLFCSGKPAPNAPSAGSEPQDSLFLALNGTPIFGSNNIFSVPIMIRVANVKGDDPFMIGPIEWVRHVSLDSLGKNSSGSHYLTYLNLAPGDYQIDLGKSWKGNVWLQAANQAGCQFYDTVGNGMKFRVMNDGTVLTWRGLIPFYATGPVVVLPPDSLFPLGYGDPGTFWRTRFRDLVHGNGHDSVMIFSNFANLGYESLPMTMQTNILGKIGINLSAYSHTVGYTILATADIPDLGLVWTYGRGNTINYSFLSVGKYWSTAKNAFWACWKYAGLAKTASSSDGNLLVPAGK